jgi:osmotically-inducible protein OsmY
MAFVVCLELLSNATRAYEPKQIKVIPHKVAAELKVETAEQVKMDRLQNTPKNLALVQNIRRNLLNDNYISKNGKKVQIIALDKEITLKGLVNSDGEKTRIINIANKFSEHRKIRNQLEVSRQ